jgi:glyoxylase-like metal-dependent hydrolase (beta-lactamase superfamily II)
MAASPDAPSGPRPDGPATPDRARLDAAAITRVVLPAGNEMGTVNAWLIDDDPLTLVDAGSGAPGALQALIAALATRGRRLHEVGLVVLTHHHADHLGLVAEVVRRSGADVAALHPIAPYLEDLSAHAAADRDFSSALLARHGADQPLVDAHRAGWSTFHRLAEPARVTVPLLAGSRITLRDRALEVLHRPGHSETDVLLVDVERGLVLGGDHLLASAPSVPVRDRPITPGRPYAPATDDLEVLGRYRASLQATEALPVDLVLPGHGAAFPDPAAVVARHLRRQERDVDRVLDRAGREPLTAVELTRRLWPAVDGALTFVLLSAVLGALGVLVAEGRMEHAAGPAGDPVRFVAA